MHPSVGLLLDRSSSRPLMLHWTLCSLGAPEPRHCHKYPVQHYARPDPRPKRCRTRQRSSHPHWNERQADQRTCCCSLSSLHHNHLLHLDSDRPASRIHNYHSQLKDNDRSDPRGQFPNIDSVAEPLVPIFFSLDLPLRHPHPDPDPVTELHTLVVEYRCNAGCILDVVGGCCSGYDHRLGLVQLANVS